MAESQSQQTVAEAITADAYATATYQEYLTMFHVPATAGRVCECVAAALDATAMALQLQMVSPDKIRWLASALRARAALARTPK